MSLPDSELQWRGKNPLPGCSRGPGNTKSSEAEHGAGAGAGAGAGFAAPTAHRGYCGRVAPRLNLDLREEEES
jgi:hypothetical protein